MRQSLFGANISIHYISASLLFSQSLLLLISAFKEEFKLILLPLVALTFLPPLFFVCIRYNRARKNSPINKEFTLLQLRIFSCVKMAYQIILLEYYLSTRNHEGQGERIMVGTFFQINISLSILELKQINLLEQAALFGAIHLYIILRISANPFCLTTVVINCLHLMIVSAKVKNDAKNSDNEKEGKCKRIQFFERLIREVLPCGIIFLETPQSNQPSSNELLISYNKYFFSLFEPKTNDSEYSEGVSPRKMRPSIGTEQFDCFLSELRIFFREDKSEPDPRRDIRSVSIRVNANRNFKMNSVRRSQQIELGFLPESLKHLDNFHHHHHKELDNNEDSSQIKLDCSHNNHENSVSFAKRATVKNLLDIKSMLSRGWTDLIESLPSHTLYDYERDCININLIYEPKADRVEQSNFEIRSFTYNLQICRTVREDECTLYLLLFTDISAIEHMRELEMQDKQKNKLLSTISHNLKTPLHGIIGVFEELETLSNPQSDELVKIGKRSAHILDSLVNDLIDFSLISSGKLVLREDVVNIAAFTRDILETVRSQARYKGLELLEERDECLPKYIITDEQRLRQILLNLLSNAIKFTEKGNVTLSIGSEYAQGLTQKNIFVPSGDSRGNKKYHTHVVPQLNLLPTSNVGRNHRSLFNNNGTQEIIEESSSQLTELIFCVSDTGIGMEEIEMRTIFKLFNKYERKSSTLARTTPGSGIGLVIANALVKKLNQKKAVGLQMESEYNVGSKFWFTIPCKLKLDSADLFDDVAQIAIEEKPNIDTLRDSLRTGRSDGRIQSPGCEKQALLSKAEIKNSINSFATNDNTPNTTKKARDLHPLEGIGNTVKGKSMFVPVRANNIKSAILSDDTNVSSKNIKKRDSDLMLSIPMIDLELIERMKKKKHKNNKRMLIVDDDIINITVATKYLDSFKIPYKVAEHGLKALQILEEEARKGIYFDAILMDLNMPIMDGIQATKQIKEKISAGELRPVHIIACTANVSHFDRKMCSDAGMSDFMTKPLKKLELKKKLEHILDMQIEYDTPALK